VRFLGENAKKDPAEYLKFFAEFGQFIKVTLLVLELASSSRRALVIALDGSLVRYQAG
tara:strand:- start:751 stop:924 length:174 start_codon:yes stop_codon:yes gene_type:complete